MAFLISQMWAPLLLVLVIAAAMGWMWHAIRSSARLRDMESERETLRRELVDFVEPDDRDDRAEEYVRAIEVMRTRESVAEARWAELEHHLTEVKAQRDDYAGRAAELERALERLRDAPQPAPVARDEDRARIEALESEVSRLNAALAAAPKEDDRVRPLAWRARYFEARTRYLEGEGRAAAPTPGVTALAALESERDAARAEAQDWRARAEAPRETDELTALKWRARYLEARTRYLESQAREASPPVDEEAARRAHWRKRYLERRNAHLEMRMRTLIAAPEEDSVSRRLQWRARYLDARVQHLEAKLAAPVEAPAPIEAAAPIEAPEPAPLVPHGDEVRPAPLPAPRQGAPDDLTLIVGVGPKTEVTLHALGVYHFDQIAAWTPANIAWVDQYLRFRGRIVRERWVAQADDLAR
ncbi:MAG: hypothetical protein GC206_09915, partial [Alphaproteobacteria bacterium]|nr:hypothetical protein [Alphaproteobacteria bacterium]